MRSIAAFAVLGIGSWLAFKIIFGFAGGLLGLLFALAWMLLKAAVVVLVLYWVLSVVAPDVARRMRNGFREEL